MKRVTWLVLLLAVATGGLAAWLYEADRSVEELSAWTNAASRFVDVDGLRVHYRDEGVRDGPVLLLLHGTAASLHTWDGWTASLSNRHRIVRLDLPAYGLTGPRADRDYRIGTYVDFVEAFVTAVGLPQFHIAGNSLGGNIAWRYALAHPERVQSVTLIDASGYPRDESRPLPLAFRLARTPIAGELLRHVSLPSLYRASLEDVYADDSRITDALVRRYYELGLRAGNRDAFLDRARMVREPAHDRIAGLEAPTLVMWGAADTWIPVSNAWRFLADLPNAVLALYDGAGHVPMEEMPEATAACAAAFVRVADRLAGAPADTLQRLRDGCVNAHVTADPSTTHP